MKIALLTDTTYHKLSCGPVCGAKPHLAADPGLLPQMKTFFTGLFDASDWPARWHCGTWSDFHGWLYIISDLLIWGAYFAIPVLLFLLVRKRKDIPFPRLIWLFIAFILYAGLRTCWMRLSSGGLPTG